MNKQEVEKIYRLANLSLEGKDTDLLSNKFNKVIDFIEEIFTIDTNDMIKNGVTTKCSLIAKCFIQLLNS